MNGELVDSDELASEEDLDLHGFLSRIYPGSVGLNFLAQWII